MKIKDKPYLSHEKFRKFFSDLEALGFEEKNPAEMMKEIRASGSVPYLKKKFEGREKIYERKFGIRKIFVCTSFVESINDINKEDYIWIGSKTIGNPITFFWFPLRRSPNFSINALADVEMLIEVVIKWPVCQECHQELLLVHYPEVMHLMMYICGNSKFIHRRQNRVPYAVFDNPKLSDKTSLRMFNRYQQFYQYEYQQHLIDPDKKHEYARTLRAQRKRQAQLKDSKEKNQYGDIKKIADDVYDDGPHNDGSYGD
ncbi:MAG: hypothetical protein JWM92_621 [Candidatus Nomurabacteria bacterium]|nr:hypothetical protein [Candidatus Nomurabacteria bacterium]